VLAAQNNIAVIHFLAKRIKLIEKEVHFQIKFGKEFTFLLTIPGIEDILAVTIMLDLGDMSRFPKAGDYSSYCRCVKSERFSNGKKRMKIGQRMAPDTYPGHEREAANFAIRFCPMPRHSISARWARRTG